jgi:hypothetical protein
VCDQGIEALASIEQGFQQVEVMKGLEQVELVISTNAHFSVSVAAQAVAKLIPQHPGATFRSILNCRAMPSYALTSTTKIRQHDIKRRPHLAPGYRSPAPEIKSRRLNQFQQPTTMR